MRVFIKTFGCIQNRADSERIRAYFWEKGDEEAKNPQEADLVVINSCVVRESAENRVYGLINNLKNKRVIVTGCLVGIKRKIAGAEVWPINKFKVDGPMRDKGGAALVPIGSGCDHYCSYCIVPYARGREVYRGKNEILDEIDKVIEEGFEEVVLIGQSVNSYQKGGFAKLLEEVAKKKLKKISFISSNPWDFSDELIEVIAKYPNIDRLLHIPLQSGDNKILRRMNRGYTRKEYLELIKRIRSQISDVRISTDIIIGFPGEDERAFQNTVDVCKKLGFEIAYLNKYSKRKGTLAAKIYQDDVPMAEKKRRWRILNELVNVKVNGGPPQK